MDRCDKGMAGVACREQEVEPVLGDVRRRDELAPVAEPLPCSLDQMLNLLANLNSNPYLAGIEELNIKCGQKDRRQMDLVMTVSTFAK